MRKELVLTFVESVQRRVSDMERIEIHSKTPFRKGMQLIFDRMGGPFTVKNIFDIEDGMAVVYAKKNETDLNEEFVKAMEKPDNKFDIGIDMISPDANRQPFVGRRMVRR